MPSSKKKGIKRQVVKVHTVFWGEESSEGGTEWTYQGTWGKLFRNSRLVVKRKGASLRHGMHPSLLFCYVHFRVSSKQVADPGFGENVARMRGISFDFASQAVDVDLQHVALTEVF